MPKEALVDQLRSAAEMYDAAIEVQLARERLKTALHKLVTTRSDVFPLRSG